MWRNPCVHIMISGIHNVTMPVSVKPPATRIGGGEKCHNVTVPKNVCDNFVFQKGATLSVKKTQYEYIS